MEELDELEKELSEVVRKISEKRGFSDEKSKNLLSDLVIAFTRSLTDGKISDVDEWMSIAFRAKRVPVCRHPCAFSDSLEKVLMKYRFTDFHFRTILRRIS
jgi:hypothetical protein